ncbi:MULTISPECIES: hypothetical protein [Niastella]|uniref:Lipoprotein n=1 Tax=Niastella soli TaxID=2821487 RepID=A0ABS3Z2P2_9BACT|nr:hypothetical protein [Niastella soli]MBO9204399.1 hypothetical protein [Niastella soli]
MKITLTALLLITSCVLLSSTCQKEDPDPICKNLTINNNTDKAVYTLFSFDYPDTSLNFQNPVISRTSKKLAAHSQATIDPRSNCLEQFLDNPGVQKLSVFVFDAELVESTPWDQIRTQYQIIKRLDLTQDDLINNNYSFDLQ